MKCAGVSCLIPVLFLCIRGGKALRGHRGSLSARGKGADGENFEKKPSKNGKNVVELEGISLLMENTVLWDFLFTSDYKREGRGQSMLEQIMNSPHLDCMQRGLQAATLRHEVISDNIANVNTPRFKKRNVVFEELLAEELAPTPPGKLEMVRTHDRHLPKAPRDRRAVAVIQTEDTDTMRVDGNNVDVDLEMANLAKNQLYYNALATQMRGYVRKVKDVITSGQS